MNTTRVVLSVIGGIVFAFFGSMLVTGCDRNEVTAPGRSALEPAGVGVGAPAPGGLATVSFGGEELTFWPYTGTSFDGTPSDPINLIFVGRADPLRIRAALLALDGDRTAFNLPPVFPFNATWREAIGGVQTCFAEDEGWLGSVVQLELGSYESIRFHLRLFGTGVPYGDDGQWVVAAAHLDVLIPGTADHQVLSWEIPEQILIADFIRSGLLDPAMPMMPSGPINQAPSFRDIPAPIYNGLPAELVQIIQGPSQPVGTAVPLPNDGQAMILNLSGEAPVVAGQSVQELELTYDQVIPRPFCMDSPLDWVLLTGPIRFVKRTTVTPGGGYHYTSNYQGSLTVVPVDILASPVIPIGEPFQAVVNGNQEGQLSDHRFWVQAQDRRIGPQEGGTELQMIRLKVATDGANDHREKNHCLTDSP